MTYFVKTYMDRTFPVIDLDSTVSTAARVIAEGKKEFALVIEKGIPMGIISAMEIVSHVVARAIDASKVKVREVMTPLVSVDPDDDLMKASEIMLKSKQSRLAVVKAGIVYGVLTAQGIAERCPEYIDKAMRDILKWHFPWKP